MYSQVSNDNDDLANETQPELPVDEWVVPASADVPDGRVGEHVSWAKLGWRRGSSDNDDDRTEELSTGQSRTHMQSGQCLEEDHTETDTLNGIKDSEP
jgi:hypothetical protein